MDRVQLGLSRNCQRWFIYKKYVLGVRYANLNGTHETTIIPTAMEGIFTILTRISWEDGDFYKFKTSPGTYVFYNDDIIEGLLTNTPFIHIATLLEIGH